MTRPLYGFSVGSFLLSLVAAPILFGSRFFSSLGNALFGERESFVKRLKCFWHFLLACHWARSLRREPVALIHAPWIHSCGSVGMYGAWLLDVPFSFTGHAADLFRERVALKDKVRRADFIICISTFHRDFYKSLGARDEQLHIAFTGIHLEGLTPKPPTVRAGRPVEIVSMGRLVEKKGFEYLVDACAILVERGVDLRCTIAGSGPLEAPLKEQVERLGLASRVTVTGRTVKQADLAATLHAGDIFCLPCVPARDGDIDGLPQVLMEAMACGLPAVSTRLVGIPDLVVPGKTGLLVEPRDARQAADAIQALIDDPELSGRLAAAGRAWVYAHFDIATCLEPMIDQFRIKLTRLASLRAVETESGRVERSLLREGVQ